MKIDETSLCIIVENTKDPKQVDERIERWLADEYVYLDNDLLMIQEPDGIDLVPSPGEKL